MFLDCTRKDTSLSSRVYLSQNLHGLVSSNAQQPSRTYASLSNSRQIAEQHSYLRKLSTLEDYQSRVRVSKQTAVTSSHHAPHHISPVVNVLLWLQLNAINDSFVEARDEIEYAKEVSTAP